VPDDLVGELSKAKIVITNYHAFMRRERSTCRKPGASLLQGRGEELNTSIRRADDSASDAELMSMKNILVLNDEAHHCYRAKRPTRTRKR